MAVSTPEAELTAGNTDFVYEMLLAQDVCDLVLRRDDKAVHLGDNQAMIRAIRTDRNPTMRHLPRVHRVNLASLHERHSEEGRDSKYCDTNEMAADIYTKHFTAVAEWKQAVALIHVNTKE